MNKNKCFGLLLGLYFLIESPLTEAAPKLTYLFDLTKNTGYDSLLLHQDKIWVGLEEFQIENAAGNHRIYVFDAALPEKKPEQVKLPHAPQYLYSYDAQTVIAVGMSAHGSPTRWQSHYSLIRQSVSGFSVQTVSFPTKEMAPNFPSTIFVKQFARLGNRDYFGLRYGENAIAELTPQQSPKKLPFRITMPNQLLAFEQYLFAVEDDFVDNLIRINPKTGQVIRLYDQTDRPVIQRLYWSERLNKLAVATTGGVQIVDPTKMIKTDEYPFGSNTTALGTYENCLVVGTEADRRLHFLSHTNGHLKYATSWDLSVFGGRFESLRNLVIDNKRQRLYVRATRACPACGHSPNGLVMGEDIGGETAKLCQ